MAKWLDKDGTSYLWEKIKSNFADKTHYHTSLGNANTITITVDSSNAKIISNNDNEIITADNEKVKFYNSAANSPIITPFYTKLGNGYLTVGKQVSSDGYKNVTVTFTGDGSETTFYVWDHPVYSMENEAITVKKDDVLQIENTDYRLSQFESGYYIITFMTAPADGSIISVSYRTNSAPNSFVFGNGDATAGLAASFGRATASGGYSFAEGYNSVASGSGAHAEGGYSYINGNFIFSAPGGTASGHGSHAQNTGTIAASTNQTALGKYNISDSNGTYAVIVGNGSYDEDRSNAFAIKWDGSVEAGNNVVASGNYSHAEGNQTIASGNNSHAEGNQTTAKQGGSHAEGYKTLAQGYYSHAEGYNSVALGMYSHAEGYGIARGDASHAQNLGTIASGKNQTAIGKYNIPDSTTITRTGDGVTTLFSLSPELSQSILNFDDVCSIRINQVEIDMLSGLFSVRQSPPGIDFSTAPPADASIEIEISKSNYAFIIGNGNSSTRSNALTVDWNGTLKTGNITIYGTGSNNGTNSILIGDDVTIGDCNVGGCFGMKSTGTNAGFRFFNSSGSSIGGLQSTNGTLQWINSSGTAYNIYHSGNSHSHNYIDSRGNVTCETGKTRPAVAGLSMSQVYSNGYPTSYGNVLTFNGLGEGQLLIGWAGSSGAHAPNYVRSLRDTNDASWSGWAQIYTSAHPQPSSSSDKRLKDHIDYIGKEAINFIKELKPAHFIRHARGQKFNELGFYAQDVQKIDFYNSDCVYTVDPNSIDETERLEGGTLLMDYKQLIAPLVATTQDLLKRVEELENEVNELKLQIKQQ